MKFEWIIDAADKTKYRAFVAQWKGHRIVKEREKRNLQRIGIDLTPRNFWRKLAGCLLTTQQRSGENSKVAQFLRSGNPLLDWSHCRSASSLAAEVERTLGANGMRRGRQIGKELAGAAALLRDGGWAEVKIHLQKITTQTTKAKEREVASFLRSRFKGLGPKQSRNLIQWLGLSQYEVPLDSRMAKTLRRLNFPVPVSAGALSDEDYYCFVEDGLHLMLAQIKIQPCIFDACAFASMEAVPKERTKTKPVTR